ncbi:MAG: YicC family protein [Oscillospiraceae bacterium]|nr:YicC family protein [Oscillospiraceae bacterium]
MTGYGSAKGTVEGLNISAELKSVNNRYLDVSVRLPRGFLFAEEAIKAAVQQHISRGKVDVFLTVDSSQAADTVVRVNEPLLRAYLDALDSIATEHGLLHNDVTALSVARFPDVLSVEKAEADQDALRAGLVALMDEALAEYDRMRLREGLKLREDVESRLVTIEALVTEVETHAPETVEAYHNRLRQKLESVLEGKDVDEARVITECAVFADRVAVDEETVRLRSHIAQMRQMLAAGSPFGRKADFLIQEFNREANTIGSKCQNADIAKVVVDLKSEIEKIREQIQNIE